MAEINSLRIASKKLTLMIQLLEGVSSHGLESDEYKQAYDIVETSLGFEPSVELEMPPHLRYARHALDLRSTVSIDRFLTCISSEALRDQGVTNVEVEQAVAHTLFEARSP